MSQSIAYTDIDLPARGKPRLLDRLWRDTAYSLTALPIGIVTFTLVVTGLSAGVSLAIVWVGIPILVGTMLASRGIAAFERIRLRHLELRAAPSPEYVVRDAEWGPIRRFLTPLRDPQSWLDTAWGISGFVTGLFAFVVTVTWWATAAGGLTYWFWQHWIPEDGDNETLGVADRAGRRQVHRDLAEPRHRRGRAPDPAVGRSGRPPYSTPGLSDGDAQRPRGRRRRRTTTAGDSLGSKTTHCMAWSIDSPRNMKSRLGR